LKRFFFCLNSRYRLHALFKRSPASDPVCSTKPLHLKRFFFCLNSRYRLHALFKRSPASDPVCSTNKPVRHDWLFSYL